MPANREIPTRSVCDTSSDTRDPARHSKSLLEQFSQDDIHSASSGAPNITTIGYAHDTFMAEPADMLPESNPTAMPPATSNGEELFPLTSQTSKDTDVMEPWISLRSDSEPVFRISYLMAEGCFDIPHESILRQFLRYYFLFVQPMLPMINEKQFWDDFNLSGSTGHYALRGPSLLLLQAMLFAASPVSIATSNFILPALIKLPVRSRGDVVSTWILGRSSGQSLPVSKNEGDPSSNSWNAQSTVTDRLPTVLI